MTLEINNITKKFEKNIVLNDISVVLESGVYGLLGANGSGKTTLMRVICGVIKANEGTVIYNGEDTNEKSVPFRSILGFLPQDF